MNHSGQNNSLGTYYSPTALPPAKPARGFGLTSFLLLAGIANAGAAFVLGAAARMASGTSHTFITNAGAASLKRLALFGAALAMVKVILVFGMWGWQRIAVMAFGVVSVLSLVATLKGHSSALFDVLSMTMFVAAVASRWAHFD